MVLVYLALGDQTYIIDFVYLDLPLETRKQIGIFKSINRQRWLLDFQVQEQFLAN
jgi:hypothetical protein